MAADFRWNEWNLEHIVVHGVTIAEAESVVRNAKSPYPESIGGDKYRVYGKGRGGRVIHLIFVMDDDGEIYIIHARPVVKDNERHRVRRRSR